MRRPLTDFERPFLQRMGRRLRKVREDAGYARRELSDPTALNPQTIYRIELGLRRTRRSTLRVLAEVLVDHPEALTAELVDLAGPALAAESPYAERIARRRSRRLRRIEVLAEREQYWQSRATLEAEWRRRADAHAAFRANMRSSDLAFRMLKRLGALS